MILIIIFIVSNRTACNHHISTPSLPLTIEIIISVNDDNDGRPLTFRGLFGANSENREYSGYQEFLGIEAGLKENPG